MPKYKSCSIISRPSKGLTCSISHDLYSGEYGIKSVPVLKKPTSQIAQETKKKKKHSYLEILKNGKLSGRNMSGRKMSESENVSNEELQKILKNRKMSGRNISGRKMSESENV